MTEMAARIDLATASAAVSARALGWRWWWNDTHRAALLERW
jgi:hypothetical protein